MVQHAVCPLDIGGLLGTCSGSDRITTMHSMPTPQHYRLSWVVEVDATVMLQYCARDSAKLRASRDILVELFDDIITRMLK